MSSTVLLTTIQRADNVPLMYTINAPYNCGTVSLVTTDAYTEKMFAELPNLVFSIYTLEANRYVLYRPRALSMVIPKADTPTSAILVDIPTSCMLAITPVFDAFALESHNQEVAITGGKRWTSLSPSFPIKVIWDNANVIADSGGGSGDTYTKEEVDNLLHTHFKAGVNIEIVDNQDSTQTINATGDISSVDEVAREGVRELQDIVALKPTIYYNTTDYWNSQSTLVSESNTLYVYTDYDVADEKNIPAFKVGDGITVVKDLPFLAGSVTSAQIATWDNKVSASISDTDNENLLLFF